LRDFLAETRLLRYTFRDDMPRHHKSASDRPTPMQLPLFAETASLVRIRPALNEWRYYRMEVWPDLFGRALLVRQWGRIGTEGHRRLDPHPDLGAAIYALADILQAKRRRGCQARIARVRKDPGKTAAAECDPAREPPNASAPSPRPAHGIAVPRPLPRRLACNGIPPTGSANI
jgi:predicted DNA-binding WGR domain protein